MPKKKKCTLISVPFIASADFVAQLKIQPQQCFLLPGYFLVGFNFAYRFAHLDSTLKHNS